MRSFAAGRVEVSRDPSVPVGTKLTGLFGWQDYAVVQASAIECRIDEDDLPLSTALGVMGIKARPRTTGCSSSGSRGRARRSSSRRRRGGGLLRRPDREDQRVPRGGHRRRRDQRALCVERFGIDTAIDHKAADFGEQLATASSDGVDVYFDNTAGRPAMQ